MKDHLQKHTRRPAVARFVAGYTLLAAALVALILATGAPASGEPGAVLEKTAGPAARVVEVALADAAKPDPGTGTFKGTVVFDGTPPDRKVIVKAGDPKVKPEDRAICAAADLLSDELLVNTKSGNGVANVFIYLRKAPEGYKAPPAPEEPVVQDQMSCRFIPHAMLVRCGQQVLVKSGDNLVHNTHTNPVTNSRGFNQAIKPNDREGVAYKYDKPERVPVKVVCDFHPWMNAWQLPLDHPFAAVTDADGRFEISGLPPGKYTFSVWHETPGYLSNNKLAVEIKAGQVTSETLKYTAAQFKVK